MNETTIKMGKKQDGGQWVYGMVQDRKENEPKELSVIVDALGQSHVVKTDSIFNNISLRDGRNEDLYAGHIVSCVIDGERVIQLVESGFEITDKNVETIWMPFDNCSMRRGSLDQLVDVKIIGHAYVDEELLELIN